MGPRHTFTLPRFIMIASFRSSAHTLLARPFALLVPLPAMHFPPQSASLTLAYSPDLSSEIISLGESSPSSHVDQILHYKLSLYKSVYSNMLSGVSVKEGDVMAKKRSEQCPCEGGHKSRNADSLQEIGGNKWIPIRVSRKSQPY